MRTSLDSRLSITIELECVQRANTETSYDLNWSASSSGLKTPRSVMMAERLANRL